jgi:CheY-like chemotaxis protein
VCPTLYEAAGLLGAAAAAGQPYDALLLDRRVADGSLPRLREAAGTRIAAAVLIEPAHRSEVDELRQAGFDAYLVRPVRQTSLLKVVAGIVAGPREFHADPGDVKPRGLAPAVRTGRSLAVLLAEDNEINALLARAVLEGLGHTVEEVRDGAAAVAAANARPGRFDLILMDLHMPGLDGLAAVRAIREREAAAGTARAPIVAVTADVLAETRAAALAAGVDRMVEKPMTPDVLRRALAALAVGADAA